MKSLPPSGRFSLSRFLSRKRARAVVASLLLPGLALFNLPLSANPTGGVVVHGDVSFGSGAGGNLDVFQTSPNAIINWSAFSIGAGELTKFHQPGANSAVLNRVLGGNPSEIHGNLQANGSVFLINPNGILVGAGGAIDTQGLVLSTLDVSDGEFLAGGDLVFRGSGSGGVTNLGRINAIGGDVYLIGQNIVNRGSISADSGTVGLAAGEEVLLTAGTDMDGETVYVRAGGSGGTTGILNDGTITAAAVELKAHGNAYALAINNNGSVRATGVGLNGGRVYLRSSGGSIANSGGISVAAPSGAGSASALISAAYARVDGTIRVTNSDGSGGSVTISGTEKVEIGSKVDATGMAGRGGDISVEGEIIEVTATADLNVSGKTGGGSIRIGGGFQGKDESIGNATDTHVAEGALLSANAEVEGAGGFVVVWADGDTLFEGGIEAKGVSRGGFVEVSGKEQLGFYGMVSTLAENGTAGVLLLDPRNGEISTGTHDPTGNPFVIRGSTLEGALLSSNVVISTFDSGVTDDGNVNISDQVRWNSNFSLTILAEGDIYVGNDVINQGGGNVNLVAGWDPSVAPLGIPDGSSYNTGSNVDMDKDIFSVADSYGQGGGSVYVGSLGGPNIAADISVVVASRTGQTNVAGHDVNVWGSAFTGGFETGERKYSQIGYNRIDGGTGSTFAATGRIRVGAVNDVDVAANKYAVGTEGYLGWNGSDRTGQASHAQIGHGGERTAVRDMDLSGEIIVEAGNDLTITGGITINNHAKVGHGGFDNADDDDGTVNGTLGGKITVTTGGDISLQGGIGYIAYAQIGHGGYGHYLWDFTDSEILINAGGDVSLTGAELPAAITNGTRGYAQIGHGAYSGDLIEDPDAANVNSVITVSPGSGKGYKGNITINSGGKVSLKGGDYSQYSYALVGNGGFASDGDHSGVISVTADRGVTLTGGDGTSYLMAQIGHMQASAQGHLDGSVTVVSNSGGVTLTGGNNSANHAVVGNTGYVIYEGSIIGGETIVTAKGSNAMTDGISLTGGDGTYASAGIGHVMQNYGSGNNHPEIELKDDVTVSTESGGITLQASTNGYFTEARIGHGGRDVNGAKSGSISVTATQGDITLTSGDTFASSRYNSTQIGHGGYGNNATGHLVGDYSGDITVEAIDGVVTIQGGNNYGAYSMIGHGGFGAGIDPTGDYTGSISVSASGTITLAAGSESYTFALIGHGGRARDGNHGLAGETISVISQNGGLEILAGTGSDSIALVGHGDNNDSSGERKGDILVDVATEVSLVGSTNLAWIGHRTTDADSTSDADVTVRAASFDEIAGDSNSGLFEIGTGFDGAVEADLKGGTVSLIATGSEGIWVRENTLADADNDLNLISYNDIFIADDVINRGGGNINLIAGWDPTVADLSSATEMSPFREYLVGAIDMDADIFGVAGSFASGGGSVWVGANPDLSGADRSTVVGSRTGQTNVAGYDVFVWGGAVTGGINSGNRKYSQIGYNALVGGTTYTTGITEVSGRVKVNATNDVEVRANKYAVGTIGYGGWTDEDQTGYASFAQIGHGGDRTAVQDLELSGEIIVDAGNNITGRGGQTRENYAMIGHGGYDNRQSTTSSIGGNITVNAGGDIDFMGGSGLYSAAQIGHGGTRHLVNTFAESKITVYADGDVLFTGGPGAASSSYGAYALIGHGGNDSDILTADTGYSGAVSVTATGQVVLRSGGGGVAFNFAKVGHGGYATDGDHSGTVLVQSSANGVGEGVILESSDSTGSYGFTQIGHGGESSSGDFSGKITVTSTQGLVSLTGGTGTGRQSQVGHGGREADGDHTGSIEVNADGTVSLTGGSSGSYNFALIGHGGEGVDGNLGTTGDLISVAGGTGVSLMGGAGTDAFAMIGMGGVDNDAASIALFSDIEVNATTGNITVTASSGVGANGFARIGNGGATMDASADGDICVVAVDGNVVVQGGATNGAQIGSSTESGDLDGEISVYAGTDVEVSGGTGSGGFGQIGHGGTGANGAMTGGIDIVTGNDLFLSGGTSGTAYGMIGHGSGLPSTSGTRSGSLQISVGNQVVLTDNTSVVRLGHGTTTVGGLSGTPVSLFAGSIDTSASAWGIGDTIELMSPAGDVGIVLTGSDLVIDEDIAYDSDFAVDLVSTSDVTLLASIQNAGNGDLNIVGGWDGTTGLSYSIDYNNCPSIAALGVDFATVASTAGGFGDNSYGVTVGGGSQGVAVGSAGGTTTVLGYSVTLLGSDTTSGGFAQIGFNESEYQSLGGADGLGASGSIVVIADTGGEVNVEGGNTDNSEARIGHGGRSTISTKGGGITVLADDINLSGGIGTVSGAAIGHGGAFARGELDGTVSVTARTGAVSLMGGEGGGSIAQIGQGGFTYSNSTGTSNHVSVDAVTGVLLQSGLGQQSHALIGSGGHAASGTFGGNIDVNVSAGDIELLATGGGSTASAQIGNSSTASGSANLEGEVIVEASGNIDLLGGTSPFSFAQIGHGGAGGDGTQSGRVKVYAGDSITLVEQNEAAVSYVKIGHGDDMTSVLAGTFAGMGERNGDIQVGAFNDITMAGGMIGHVNAASATRAAVTGGDTYIAPSRSDEQTGTGTLAASSSSEFSSGEELRFYFPTRSNNLISAGALINGTSYIGTETDPSVAVRDDEFVRHVGGVVSLDPLEHENLTPFFFANVVPGQDLQNGAPLSYSTALGNYSLYYDMVSLTDAPIVPVSDEVTGGGGVNSSQVFLTFFDFLGLFPYDRTEDDEQRLHRRQFTQLRWFGIYYEGFENYSLMGDILFNLDFF